MEFLTNEELLELSPGQLYRLFTNVRAQESRIHNHGGNRCCEICNEFIGSDEEWEEVQIQAKKYGDYKNQIHAIMKTKPYYEKRKKALAGKKPRRNKPNRGNRK